MENSTAVLILDMLFQRAVLFMLSDFFHQGVTQNQIY